MRTEPLVLPMLDASQNESIVAMDVTDYNMGPNTFHLPTTLASPSSQLSPPKDNLNESLHLENEALRQRVTRLTQIEDYSIHLKTRVEDLERQLADKTASTRRKFSQSQIMFGDSDIGVDDGIDAEDDVETGPRLPLLSSLFRVSNSSSANGDSASKTLVRQKTTAMMNLTRFFCGVDQPNLKRAVAAARRMPLLFWTYMILIHFFFFRCFLSEFVSLGVKDGHNGL